MTENARRVRRGGLGACVLALSALLAGCGGHPGTPQPLKVVENPQTGERARFFQEDPLKTPAGYDQAAHLAAWVAARKEEGFTRDIPPGEDAPVWAAEQARARERRRQPMTNGTAPAAPRTRDGAGLPAARRPPEAARSRPLPTD
jgi:hypothetical protein